MVSTVGCIHIGLLGQAPGTFGAEQLVVAWVMPGRACSGGG